MKSILTSTALASFMVFGGVFLSSPSSAQDNQPCVGENCPAPDMQGGQGLNKKRLKGVDQDSQSNQGADDETTDQPLKRKKRAQGNQQDDVDVDVDVQVGSQQRARRGDWQFDSTRHQRRRSKNATFRFYLDGYYYAQPYWQVDVIRSGRVSCGEGRAIVSERFNRVRVVECNGGTYTYLGRRQGDTYRILLNSRTGRIVGRAMI